MREHRRPNAGRRTFGTACGRQTMPDRSWSLDSPPPRTRPAVRRSFIHGRRLHHSPSCLGAVDNRWAPAKRTGPFRVSPSPAVRRQRSSSCLRRSRGQSLGLFVSAKQNTRPRKGRVLARGTTLVRPISGLYKDNGPACSGRIGLPGPIVLWPDQLWEEIIISRTPTCTIVSALLDQGYEALFPSSPVRVPSYPPSRPRGNCRRKSFAYHARLNTGRGGTAPDRSRVGNGQGRRGSALTDRGGRPLGRVDGVSPGSFGVGKAAALSHALLSAPPGMFRNVDNGWCGKSRKSGALR